ncbi:TPA: hypothetical protein DCR49_10325 [Candidatus Delongbacteria bacterium]|nr:MAG: hypothetical protein A2Y39_02635 [Candidatus Delongbacteria bacterium GWF2_40_14]HAQ62373.1 hypothetical protein [Candidatus Delongbacteria bacterium]
MQIISKKTIILLVSFIFTHIFGGWTDDPINVGSVSFTAARWDNSYNISYSRQNIAGLTGRGKAVVLYLFEACFS